MTIASMRATSSCAPGARTARLLAQAVPRDARISSPFGPRWISLRLSPLNSPANRAAKGK